MSKRDYRISLEDILEEIERIYRFTKNIHCPKDFEENDMVFYAVLKSLEIIGEAVKNIPIEIRNKYPYEWKKIAGLRDIITHEYWGVDEEIIFDVIKHKLEELEKISRYILENEN